MREPRKQLGLKHQDRPYLGTSTILWPTARGPWSLEFHFAASETGAPICVGVDLRAFSLEDRGRVARLRGSEIHQLTAQVWRSIPIKTKIAEEIASTIDALPKIVGEDAVLQPKGRRTGPKPFWNKERLRHVAAVYRANVGAGAPTRAVAQAFGVSPSMGAKLVARARDHGLLGPASKGRVGERPAPKKKGTAKSRSKRSARSRR